MSPSLYICSLYLNICHHTYILYVDRPSRFRSLPLCLSFYLALPLSIGKFGRQKTRCLFAAAERKIKCSFLHSATLPHVTHECHVFFVTCSITNYLNGWSFYAIQELPSIKRSEVILPNAKDTDRSPMPAPSLALCPPPSPPLA